MSYPRRTRSECRSACHPIREHLESKSKALAGDESSMELPLIVSLFAGVALVLVVPALRGMRR